MSELLSKKILLTYSSFVIACMVVVTAFITATTYVQLAVAVFLYPILVFFAYKAFYCKIWKITSKKPAEEVQSTTKVAEKVTPPTRENIGISDIDKRVFLKLIGGSGLLLFLFSLFNKKTDSLFYKSLPEKISLGDSTGVKIDPAQNQPLDGYNISEIDDNLISFYGFINKDGAWYVMKVEPDTGSFRYSRGDSRFPDYWAKRENLQYDYFSNIFRR